MCARVYVLHAWVYKYTCMCKTAFLARKETLDSSLHLPLPSPCVPSQFTWHSFSPNAEAAVGQVMPLAGVLSAFWRGVVIEPEALSIPTSIPTLAKRSGSDRGSRVQR